MKKDKQYLNYIAQAKRAVSDIKLRETQAIGEDALDFMDSFLTPKEIAESELRISRIKKHINAKLKSK